MPHYLPRLIEPRWQAYWATHQTFRTPDLLDDPRPKVYLLDMFPYPSGSGLHVGHPEGYTATDILARYHRAKGRAVLHPMGWDAFGLPAEQHAIATGEQPALNTQRNIDNFRRQIESLGFSYDWQREVNTTDPSYVKWTQWIFLVLYDTWYDHDRAKGRPIADLPIPTEVSAQGADAIRRYTDGKRLAFQSYAPVNWCPALGTVLANEEVINGLSDRGDHPVERRPLRQWMLRITDYAERLLADLDPLDWSEGIKAMQRQWIGKSVGAEVDFALVGHDASVRVFTTRPDTLYGATYLVLAPEHPLTSTITTPQQCEAVTRYQEAAARKSEFDRTQPTKTKTGVDSGASARHPLTGEAVPIWVADYVLGGYGTGAIMAVPAHDERDFAFARQFGLPMRTVVAPAHGAVADANVAFTDEGVAVHSGDLDGLTTAEAKAKVIAHLEAAGTGAGRVNYKLRDWLFSRQRYWGEPFPIWHELDAAGTPTGVVVPVPFAELPVRLPELVDFKPTGSPEGPLAKAVEWIEVTRQGRRYRRETNTMPQWAGSCWYYLRYIDPHNDTAFADPEKLRRWLPVDLYVGGAEHAVLHLLYARFWHKVLYDRGHVPTAEPFQRLINQGMILGEPDYHISPAIHESRRGMLEARGLVGIHTLAPEKTKETYILRVRGTDDTLTNLSDDMVEKRQGKTYLKETDIEMTPRAEKMSKARGNVVNPDDVVAEYGADSLRLYEMFMGPLEATKPWQMRGVEGVYRFLGRVWRLLIDEAAEEPKLSPQVSDAPPTDETLRMLHATIKKVGEDIERLQFNTAISAMMELSNHLTGLESRPRTVLEPFVQLLAPFAPHMAEELWRALGYPDTLAYEPWPSFDEALTRSGEVEVPVQVNGKLRAKVRVAAGADRDTLEAAARADTRVAEQLAGREVKKVVVVPGKLVNFVL